MNRRTLICSLFTGAAAAVVVPQFEPLRKYWFFGKSGGVTVPYGWRMVKGGVLVPFFPIPELYGKFLVHASEMKPCSFDDEMQPMIRVLSYNGADKQLVDGITLYDYGQMMQDVLNSSPIEQSRLYGWSLLDDLVEKQT